MATITRRIELKMHYDSVRDPDKEQYNNNWNYWHQINDNLYRAANYISSHLFFNDAYEERLRIQSKRYNDIRAALAKKDISSESSEKLKEERKNLNKQFKTEKLAFLGGSEQNSTYKVVSYEFLSLINSNILTSLNQSITNTYKEHKKEMYAGTRAISNYKKGMPVPFQFNNTCKLLKRSDGSIYLKWLNNVEWDLFFGKDSSNNREIVERTFINSGSDNCETIYKVCGSSIQQKSNNDKVFLLLVVCIPNKSSAFVEGRAVGIDLGINVPLYAALNDNEYGGMSIGSREEFLKVRERMFAQKRELQRSLRTSTDGGRGRQHKLQALERLGDKERNWVHLQNHIFSKSVIQYALDNRAGIIKMEGLGGFGRDKDNNIADGYKYLLRYWSYFELQTLIAYKATANGIQVKYVNPYHTSQTCSFCGHFESGQRIKQEQFICKNPDCIKGKGNNSDGVPKGINADWNAARNIAMSEDYVDKSKKNTNFVKNKK